MSSNKPEVTHIPAGGGIALWVPEEPPAVLVDGEGPVMSSYTFAATADLTGGSLSLVDTVVPPGNGPPRHAHADEDESFFVLEGSFEVRAGGKTFVIDKGDYAFIPRGTEHVWKNIGSETARMIRIYTPGGMEKFFSAIGREAVPGEPAPRLTNKDVQRAVDGAEAHYAAKH